MSSQTCLATKSFLTFLSNLYFLRFSTHFLQFSYHALTLEIPSVPYCLQKNYMVTGMLWIHNEGKHPPKHPRLNCYLQESLANESQVGKGGGEKAKHACFTLSEVAMCIPYYETQLQRIEWGRLGGSVG